MKHNRSTNWYLWSDRWLPFTKDQICWKRFYAITSYVSGLQVKYKACHHALSVSIKGKYLQVRRYFWALRSFLMFTCSLSQIKLELLSIILAHGELWNPLSKAVPGKIHVSGGYSILTCLQNRANFQRFQSTHRGLNNTANSQTIF